MIVVDKNALEKFPANHTNGKFQLVHDGPDFNVALSNPQGLGALSASGKVDPAWKAQIPEIKKVQVLRVELRSWYLGAKSTCYRIVFSNIEAEFERISLQSERDDA